MESNSVKDIIKVMSKLKGKAEMSDFLLGILTPQEIEEIATRLSILKMLDKGVPQHTIAKELGVGVATITRGAKELQKGRFKGMFSLPSWRSQSA